MEGISFPSTCCAEVPGKILFYQPQSGRASRSWELNTSLRAAEPTPGGAGPSPPEVRPAKSKGPQQGAGTPQFKDGDGKLPGGAGSRNRVLGGKQACSGEQYAGLMAVELRERAVKH